MTRGATLLDLTDRLHGKAERASDLPPWAACLEAQLLLSAIRDERPDTRVGDAMGFHVEQYRGANAFKLRRLFDRLLDECDDDEAAFALLQQERPDDLIGRILNG